MITNTLKTKTGFTLLETIISVSLLALVSTLVMVSFNSLNNRQVLDKQVDFIKSAINQTRFNAINSKNAADQTFIFSSSSITYDGMTINLESDIFLSAYTTGTRDILFSRLTGFPNATGTLHYKLQKGGDVIATSSISINNLGIIE